ncbi:hypothetical protein KKJ25_13535 [Xenorhabdus bovienii]|uniref:hypothetical protein n=1 Tax=Xenorhabdus bovienii TaxID=40576 RepID=UPI00237C6DD2|nr:hypothetical protein [Xenorhabdus bovienii]MDE1495931.1 hypothetical protein [Xenorhabdus bovienii]MDE9473985.1 hypothetical protein [Xenorhabdus bovienii]
MIKVCSRPGIARRRVIFPFNNPVKESEKDPQLPEKISQELPVIIRHLLNEFADQITGWLKNFIGNKICLIIFLKLKELLN